MMKAVMNLQQLDYSNKTPQMAPIPIIVEITDPMQNAIVILFHFLCHCSSSF